MLLHMFVSAAQGSADPDMAACQAANPKTVYGEVIPFNQNFFRNWMERDAAFKENMPCLRKRSDERIKEELRRRREKHERAVKARPGLKAEVKALRSALQGRGAIFEFPSENHAWEYVNQGCLIGKDSAYSYGLGQGYSLDEIAKPDGAAFAKAEALAKALLEQALDTEHLAYDAGIQRWGASIGNQSVLLKEMGIMKGELPHDGARELIEIINGWCPLAAATAASWEINRNALRNALFAPIESAAPEPARAMLDRAIVEVQSNQAAALAMFGKVVWRDLFVFCATPSGELIAHPLLALPGQKPDVFKQQWAQKFRAGVQQATDRDVIEFGYFDVCFSRDRKEVPKVAYLKKVGTLVCGVSYYKDRIHHH
jgi:hypothetical protein